jgi:hypothetical protein
MQMQKFTNVIETARDAIHPRELEPFEIAFDCVNQAQTCISEMKGASDRVHFEKAWNEFVDKLERAWTALHHDGAAVSSRFQPWAGEIEKFRKEDELLKYLVQSRHISQHSFVKLRWDSPRIHLRPEKDGAAGFRNLKIYKDGSNEIEFSSSIPGNRPKVVFEPGQAHLPEIYNTRHKQTFSPPRHHRGKPLGSDSPIEAARLALDFYQANFAKAIERFGARNA